MKGTFKDFAQKLRQVESSNNYQVVNQFGYLGAYQFGRLRLIELGLSIDRFGKTSHPELYKKAIKISKQDFLKNKELQDEIFIKHCKDLVKRIKTKYSRFLGKKIKGIDITLSGMVSGAHLVGLGGLIKFLTSTADVKDGNNVSVSKYLKLFKDYDLSELEDEQRK